jgi:hypothetical protein
MISSIFPSHSQKLFSIEFDRIIRFKASPFKKKKEKNFL